MSANSIAASMIIAAVTITNTAFTAIDVAAAAVSTVEAAFATATPTVCAVFGAIHAAIDFPQVKICIAP